jgi:hypothetical protein
VTSYIGNAQDTPARRVEDGCRGVDAGHYGGRQGKSVGERDAWVTKLGACL